MQAAKKVQYNMLVDELNAGLELLASQLIYTYPEAVLCAARLLHLLDA